MRVGDKSLPDIHRDLCSPKKKDRIFERFLCSPKRCWMEVGTMIIGNKLAAAQYYLHDIRII